MIARQLEAWLKKVKNAPQIVHLFGLRQTGKTTLMNAFRENFPKVLYYPLFDLVTLRKYEDHPENWVLEVESAIKKTSKTSIIHVFVDEIQKIPSFFQALQGLYEQYKGRAKFWIWGSSARPLKRQRAETLAGRSVSRVLWPLSQAEILQKESCIPDLFDFKKLEKNLEISEPRGYRQFLTKGFQQSLLPEPFLISEAGLAQELLRSYQATYIENEIRRENMVEDIGRFEQFLTLAASESAQIVDYSSKAKVLGISPHTVKAYYGILEDTFVCRMIQAYSQSLRVQIRKSPKAYFSEAGLARFIAGERGVPGEGTRQFGFLVENFVVMEIIKQIEYFGLPWKLSYFRTKTGVEVDLIISGEKGKIAVEIKSAKTISRKDCQSIMTLMELDSTVKFGIIFSFQSAPLRLTKNIINIPIWNL